MVKIRIEGAEVEIEDREYKGAELKEIGKIPHNANLVREEPDGSEKGIRDDDRVHPREGENFYHSPQHKRGGKVIER